ncbi:MAG: MFS transporter [Treponema sp.]|nr:MFS transporter [Treponema sp.]
MSNSLFKTLKNLRGNSRACVYTEPLWGFSINLVLPFASVYMLALGLSDYRVGTIATVYMLSQVVWAFFGGPITDKLGRRKGLAIFDFIGWCIPCLIWWRAVNFWFFFVAALINGAVQIAHNSWQCLIAEDTERSEITGVHSLISVGVQLSAFFAPITALLFSRLTLIPAMHILYVNAFIVMTIKIFLTYHFSRETKVGKIRLMETKGKSIFALTIGYGDVFKLIIKSGGTIFAMIIVTLVGIAFTINNTFWQVIISQKLLVPVQYLPFFPMLRASIIIFILFFIVPRMTGGVLKIPLIAAFICLMIGQSILILIPIGSSILYPLLCISLIFDGFGLGTLNMLSRALIALNVNPAERARVMAIIYVLIMIITAPFGWIGGMLSEISRNLPFLLNVCLMVLGIFATIIYYRKYSNEA